METVSFPWCPASYWAKAITKRWQDTVWGIVEVGKLHIQAKEALEHGEFRALIEEELPFQKTTAAALMVISRHLAISNVQHVGHLPSSLGFSLIPVKQYRPTLYREP